MKASTILLISLCCFPVASSLSCRNQSNHPPVSDLLTYNIHDISKLNKSEIEIGDRVNLETSADCVLGYPQKIIERNGILFIYSQQQKGTILLFEKATGHFIRKINPVGKGPGEYTKLRDFDLDQQSKLLYLLDQDSRVLIYSAEGVFQREIKLAYGTPAELYNLAIWDGRILVDGMDNENNSLYEFSMDGQFVKVLKKAAHLTINQMYPLTQSSDNLYFHNKICDTLFLWRKGNFEPYLVLDFGKYSLTAQEVFDAKKQQGDISSGLITKPHYRLGQFREAKRFSYFDINALNQEITQPNYFHCFIRKSDQTVLCTDHYDLFKGILWHGDQMIGISEDQEYLLTYVVPAELFEYRDDMVKKKGRECLKSEFTQLNELCNSTKIDDNPVILFVRLKGATK